MRIACAILMALGLGRGVARAQDFASAAPSWPRNSASAILEDGISNAGSSIALDATVTRWFGLESLETRSLAGMVRARAVVLAAGVSQTGNPETGWTAAGVAVGAASDRGGIAIRGVARRDRLTRFAFDGDARTAGGEVGAGAWTGTGANLKIYASAPQLWREGAAPPLGRALSLGMAWEGGGFSAWLVRRAVKGVSGGRTGEHEAGVTLAGGPLAFWCAARDRPLRASLGVSAALGGVRSAVALDSHPVLDETRRLTVSLARGHVP